jgi:arginine exporter protein ArgO
MQMQNQHLLQQVTERDDYNIKVCLVIIYTDISLLQSTFFVSRQLIAYISDATDYLGWSFLIVL